VRDTLLLIALLAGLPAPGCTPATSDEGPGPDSGLPRTDAAAAPVPDGAAAPDPGPANSVACQHLRAGPYEPVTGKPTSTYSDPGPPIQNGRKAYRLTLPAPPRTGHVSFKVPAAGEYVLFTSRSVPITVFTWDGTQLNPTAVASTVPECTEVKSRESYYLATDTKPHVFRFGGDSATPVDLVLTAAAAP
jgi:hypothetical protein